ncbi:MAG TPA: recombination mediator RecR [Candidatus Paceibacterota bacterium]|nr:recombination mediator RecR [Candidatus Paceibacterota bacterium]
MDLPKPIKNFISIFSKLPGMGPRQTTRLAFWLLHQKKESQDDFYRTFIDLFSKTQVCPNCFFITEIDQENKPSIENLCKICENPQRDKSMICVVEKETDLLSIEKTNKYHGVYHVLGRLLSEIDENKKLRITIPQLLLRIKKSQSSKYAVKEVILALSPTSEGNLTTYSIEKSIKDLDDKIKVTKLARGLPQGGEVEFADAETLTNALEGRK